MPFRFLDLPAELRIEVYKHCTLLPKQLYHFKGLFTVSKRVGDEYHAEALILLNEFLEKIKTEYRQQKGGNVEIWLSINLSGSIQVTVKLPRSLYMARLLFPGVRMWADSHTKFDHSLAPLFSLYIDELSVGFYEEQPNIPLFTIETRPWKLENDFHSMLSIQLDESTGNWHTRYAWQGIGPVDIADIRIRSLRLDLGDLGSTHVGRDNRFFHGRFSFWSKAVDIYGSHLAFRSPYRTVRYGTLVQTTKDLGHGSMLFHLNPANPRYL